MQNQAPSYKVGNGTVTITDDAVTLRAPGGMKTDSIHRSIPTTDSA